MNMLQVSMLINTYLLFEYIMDIKVRCLRFSFGINQYDKIFHIIYVLNALPHVYSKFFLEKK
jgi:hypothetical protein